jgi:hypothetical protein
MRLFALIFYFNEEVLEAFVFDIGELILGRSAISTLLSRWVIAGILNLLQVIFRHSQAINAFAIWAVGAVRLLDLFF